MGIRRTITAIVSVSALALISAPLTTATAAPLSLRAAAHWYQGKTGTVKWAIGDEFLQQLTDAGATMSFCAEAKLSVVSGVNVVTMPVHGNSVILLNGAGASIDASTDCVVTISGNGASVDMTSLTFNAAAQLNSGMSAAINDDYIELASGGTAKLPKLASRNKIAVISPVLTTVPSFVDILRSGPAPTLSTEPATLGLFQLVLKVKKTSRPQGSGNSEG